MPRRIYANRRPTRSVLSVEPLESRCLLATSLIAGTLTIVGDKRPNTIALTLNGGTGRIEVSLDGVANDADNPTGYLPGSVQSISIQGLNGNDTITIDAAIDEPAVITGGHGNDTVTGGSGDESIHGGVGHDSLSGGSGDDSIDGETGNDALFGDDDEDVLIGGSGKDAIVGGTDHDFLSGGTSNDVLNGGGGDDVLSGGLGKDTLSGGTGEDLFSPTLKGGVRTDFTKGVDHDAGQAVTVGNYDDVGLEGTRTDTQGGAPPVTNTHQLGAIDYSAYSNPPTYGPHHPVPKTTGVYDSVLDDADLVHNLEHGHVWISYVPGDLSDVEIVQLQILVGTFGSRSGIILSPRPANDAPVVLASWGRMLTLNDVDVEDIVDFILINRGHAPEGFATP